MAANDDKVTAKAPLTVTFVTISPGWLATVELFPYMAPRQRAGRPRVSQEARGKSGLHGTTVPGNARRCAIALAKAHQGKCHRKDTASLRTGKVEMVRQERTAALATKPAR